MSNLRITHIGGPTALIEVGGWRLLTDPTFDPPGQKYNFGRGTSSRKTTAAAISPAELGPIDAVLLSHDHHADNLDPAGRALLPRRGRGDHHRRRREAPRGELSWPRALEHDVARGSHQGAHRDHRHAVSSWPAAQSPDRR
jgi:hypothetical protein